MVGFDGGGRIAFPFFLALKGVEERGSDDGGFVKWGFVIEVVHHQGETLFYAPFEKPIYFGVYTCKDFAIAAEHVSSCILTDFYHVD